MSAASGPHARSSPVLVRAAASADRPAVLRLLSASLGMAADETFERFFAWKHDDNPFGRSPAWVAVDGDRIVGFRTLMRWEFDEPGIETVRRAVRAVDTATHPDHQGRGVFRRLTLHALDDLARDGVNFVFNTPNDKSRPGYLSMGWSEVGRLPVSVRPTSIRAPVRMLRARGAAQRWSVDTVAGDRARDVLADGGLPELLSSLAPPAGLRTARRPDVVRWRYGFDVLRYRAVALADDVRRGVAVFRTRRRQSAVEVALCDVLVPGGDRRAARALVRRVASIADGDYVIRVGGPPLGDGGFVRVPRQGPVLTFRALGDTRHVPPLARWQLSLGDVELF